jgi:hypothetical protein
MLKEKPMTQVIEVPDEGLVALMGKTVLLMCVNYFYTGRLVGVNETCVQIAEPSIVYETGPWEESGFIDAQRLKADYWYIQTASIESYGEV